MKRGSVRALRRFVRTIPLVLDGSLTLRDCIAGAIHQDWTVVRFKHGGLFFLDEADESVYFGYEGRTRSVGKTIR
jgi:hypothetical protein